MKLKLILSAALMAGVISATAATAPAPASTNASPEDTMKALFGDPVLVQGDGFQIKRSELDQVVSVAKASAASAGQQLPPDFEVRELNRLITMQLLAKQATVADRAAGQANANLQYTNQLKHFGSEQAFQRELKVAGLTVADLRAKTLQGAVAEAALKSALNITVTADESKAFYTKYAAYFEQPEMVHARHILLLTIDPATRTPLATNTVAAKKKQIEDLLKQIKAGGDFAALAKQYSEDDSRAFNTKENGGELPEFARGQFPFPEFEAAAFALNKDQVSDVVTSAFGFHIIKLLDKKAAKKFAYTDPVPQMDKTVADQTVAEICRAKVEEEKFKAGAPDYLKKLRAGAKLQILDPALKAGIERLEAAMKQAAALPSAEAAGK